MVNSSDVPPPLPLDWTEHTSPAGDKYYYNSVTKNSTYTRPRIQEIHPILPVNAAGPADYYQAGYFPGTHQYDQSQGQYYQTQGPHHPFQSHHQSQGYNSPQVAHSQFQHKLGESQGGPAWKIFRGGQGGPTHRRPNIRYDRRRRRGPDRPVSVRNIDCEPWILVKTTLGRRFVHNTETKESYWKIPEEILETVIKHDRLRPGDPTPGSKELTKSLEEHEGGEATEDSDEYEEVEADDDEGEVQPSKRARAESEAPEFEFTEEDMAWQLAEMEEEGGLDEEYQTIEDETLSISKAENEEAQRLENERLASIKAETDKAAENDFRHLLEEAQIDHFSPWREVSYDKKLINDPRYAAVEPKTRKVFFEQWHRDRMTQIRKLKEAQIQAQEKKDPKLQYLEFLQQYATPKLYWPEFKRKYRRQPAMKEYEFDDKNRQKLFHEYISRSKLPESTRKSDLSALLKSAPLHALNRSSNLDSLPTMIISDIRYVVLPEKVRNPLIETYISTLRPPPEQMQTAEYYEEQDRNRIQSEKRAKALAERERIVSEDKRRHQGDLSRSKQLLRESEAVVAEAMIVRKNSLSSYMDVDTKSTAAEEKRDTE
ncbi:hypothetical protein N7495_004131 [Penicillium taxi]|uniref:uncharacterized protein n=1 Tax=Penicillium taxi TaxID=168475 RepID=UPI0025450D2A|nr:uncharacterized protein N7495_004131 [Penicillium taxi]KAJ5899387.1 hypothetical protein N7495_004131 [Penicillium taxi]